MKGDKMSTWTPISDCIAIEGISFTSLRELLVGMPPISSEAILKGN